MDDYHLHLLETERMNRQTPVQMSKSGFKVVTLGGLNCERGHWRGEFHSDNITCSDS